MGGDTPLDVAAQWGDLEIIKLLLERGADVNSVKGMYGTPLKGAIQSKGRNEQFSSSC